MMLNRLIDNAFPWPPQGAPLEEHARVSRNRAAMRRTARRLLGIPTEGVTT